MKKNILLVFFILLVLLGCHKSNTSLTNSDLSLHYDGEMVDIGNGDLMPIYNYVFTDGKTLTSSPENEQLILMLNGSFKPGIKLITNNNTVLFPIEYLSDELGIQVNVVSNDNSITIKSNTSTLSLKINDVNASFNNRKFTLKTAPTLSNNIVYIPIKSVCEKMGLKVKHYASGEIDLLNWTSIITIDKDLNIPCVSQESAYKHLKSLLELGYNSFEDNFKILYSPPKQFLTDSVNDLKEGISRLKYIQTISRYYVFDGLIYTIYYDKYTRDIYFNIISICEGKIKKANFDSPKLFEYGYMVD